MKKNNLYKYLVAFVVLGFGILSISSCENREDPAPVGSELSKSMLLVMQENDDLSDLLSAMEKAGLTNILEDDTEYTIFAPVNDAFDGVDLNSLTNAELIDLLEHHVVAGRLTSDEFVNAELATLDGFIYPEGRAGGEIIINSNQKVKVSRTNIEAANGVIHKIENILFRPTTTLSSAINANSNLELLEAAITVSGLDLSTGNFTVFAPTDAAFASYGISSVAQMNAQAPSVIKALLEDHIFTGKQFETYIGEGKQTPISSDSIFTSITDSKNKVFGAGFFVNGNTKVTSADLHYSTGVLHIVDKVIETPNQNIVEVAQGNSNLSILVDALTRANLVSTFNSNSGRYTVFAPTNDAFNALFDSLGTGVNNINDISVAQLTEILQYHVLDSRVFSTDLGEGSVSSILSKDDSFVAFKVKVESNDFVIEDNSEDKLINIISANVVARNGVVHLTNRVLLPEKLY